MHMRCTIMYDQSWDQNPTIQSTSFLIAISFP